ncbi:hypothetical protein EDD11_002281 [Mortierella claussenii]|nr:hypothetical protein EDD11_002281 [Mortierella claussenii]
MPTTITTIIWPPPLETHSVTAIVNGTIITIPAYQTANVTIFPNYTHTTTTTTTKPPPTTVIGVNPPPPYVSGSPTSTVSTPDDGSDSKAVLWRNWGLVVLGVVILAVVGGLILRRYRSGRTKKQEPGNFTPVGEDDEESEGRRGTGGNGSSSTIPGASSISLATLGGHQPPLSSYHHHQNQTAASNSNVRERRNSQPIPRALDLDRGSRS